MDCSGPLINVRKANSLKPHTVGAVHLVMYYFQFLLYWNRENTSIAIDKCSDPPISALAFNMIVTSHKIITVMIVAKSFRFQLTESSHAVVLLFVI